MRRRDDPDADSLDRVRFRALLGEQFFAFARASFFELEGKDLDLEPYLEPLCFELQEVAEGRNLRLLINMPPRHLKSFCVAIAWPAFLLGRNPDLSIAVVTYSQQLSREHTEKLIRLLRSPMFRWVFPGCRFSSLRIEKVATTQGGAIWPIAVGGSFTGIGADVLVLDDMIKAKDVEYPAQRQATFRYYQDTALTRLNDHRTGRIVAAQQRLHQYDLSSELIEGGTYRHMNLPSIAARDQTFPLHGGREWTMKAGDLLSPTRLPQEALDKLRIEMGTAAFSAQFLQEPLPAGSMLLDLGRVHWVDNAFDRSSLLYVVQSIDTAITMTDRSDYSVIMTFGWNGESWCILHILRDRYDLTALKQMVVQQSRDWRADKVLIENSHIGIALRLQVKDRVPGVMLIGPKGSKEERLAVSTEALYEGRIVIPTEETWSGELRQELRDFPGGRHDDMVDALTQFIAWPPQRSIQRQIDLRNGIRPRRTLKRRGRRAEETVADRG